MDSYNVFSTSLYQINIGLVHKFVRFMSRRLSPNKNCMLATYNIPFHSFCFSISNLFGIFRFQLMVRNFQDLWIVRLRKINISDTFSFTSSIEAPKLQRPPQTFLPSTEKIQLLKEGPKNCLRSSSKAILTRVTLRARGGHVVHLVGYGGHYPL
jgi:hypothetical protein